jgi:hypothetical protein
MQKMISRCFVVLLLSLSAQPLLAEPASRTQATYDVIGFGMTLANITETFTRTDDNYQIESVTKAVGMLARFKPETIRISSRGKVTPQGLRPYNYSMTREIDTGKNASAKFNWEKNIVTQTDYKGVNDLPLPPATQDRLSVLYSMPIQAKSEQSEYKFSITDGNNLDAYSFNISPNEREITVPLGTYKTRYVTSTPVGEEVKYEIWMATEFDNFPCKVIVTDSNGGKLTQVLTGLTITP